MEGRVLVRIVHSSSWMSRGSTAVVLGGIAASNPNVVVVRRSFVWDASDEALLAGLAAGDRTAAVVFVRRFQRRVFGLALAVLHDEGRAAEVAQDVFVRAWNQSASFDPRRGSVTTWLLAITRNLSIDRLRMEGARPVSPVDPVTLVGGPDRGDPEDSAVTASETRRVLAALAVLPEEQRRCVVLATIGGRTAREIGESERIPLGTAKTRIRDGLLRLRALLERQETAND
jgi:RNA polymerase sigma factor (sigma-70 family)